MSKLDWSNLNFGYLKTNYNIRCYYRNGEWGELEVHDSDKIELHMAATCLHYGQEAFEGLKAFKGPDGKVRIFRMDENAKRMQSSSDGILMAKVPAELFEEAVIKAVTMNKEYIPPYESGAALYIRPLLLGTGPQVGVKPAQEYLFMVFVTPVGPYFKEGFKPTNVVIMREFDRAAPQGTGNLKVGGNYAAGMRSGIKAHTEGYSAVLYLDSKEKKYIDECGPANFFGIKNSQYITPESKSILPSITNKSLKVIAEDMGLEVVSRRVPYEELETFDEVGMCGTAAVISPIGRIDDADNDVSFVYSKDGKPGPVSEKLYKHLKDIQYGIEPDKYGWVTVLD